MSCAVKGCSNIKRFKPEGISFHLFPRGELLTTWLTILCIDKDTWTWSKNKFVCSNHFRACDFIVTGSKKYLKVSTVPYISAETCETKCENTSKVQPTTSQQSFSEATVSFETSQTLSSSMESEITPQTGQRKLRKRKLRTSGNSTNTSTSSSSKRRKIAFVKSIHNYSTSPTTMKHKNLELKRKHYQYRKKLYVAKQRITKLQRQVTSLTAVVKDLKEQQFLSDHAVDHLQKTFDSVPHLLMSRYLKNCNNSSTTHEKYPPVLREFASTLQFYSSKGYEYVRQQFALSLPHQATIRKWCSNIHCNPGFIDLAFEALKIKVAEASSLGREVICSLMLDEMAIKKQIDFDGTKLWGYIDVGVGGDYDELQPATEALVLMVVAMQSHWKIPISYFLIKSLNGEEKANIVNEALIRLHQIGVVITSITCDGPSAHFSMMKHLGCNFDNVHDMKTWFLHPSTNTKTYCVLDACHMLKLIRNCLATLNNLKDPNGNIVSWTYIVELNKLQQEEMFNIVNKLKRSHIEWYKQKMKVNLAAQTLSSSVADALDFVHKELKLPQFENCDATVNFIRKVNILFDILNSKSPWAKGFKAPLRAENEFEWRAFIDDIVPYLLNCSDIGGRPLWATPRKTPFIGFIVTTLSMCGIFEEFVQSKRLNYLLTFKCSQDHLEIFFCMVRSRNGWNNNPTALQFMRTFKKLLLHSHLSGRGGNCKVLDTTTVLTVPSTQMKSIKIFDVSLIRKYNIDMFNASSINDHDYDILPHSIELTDLSANIITYIAGFVVRMIVKTFPCTDCLNGCGAFTYIENAEDKASYKLLFLKNRGGLYIPAEGVSTICSKIEKQIRKIIQFTNYKLPTEDGFFDFFILITSQQFYEHADNIFPNLKNHFQEENHSFLLIKVIVAAYIRIRFFNLAKRYTSKIQGNLIRQELTKLILFNHQ